MGIKYHSSSKRLISKINSTFTVMNLRNKKSSLLLEQVVVI